MFREEILVMVFLQLVSASLGQRPSYAPWPADLHPQIIPTGQAWPSSPDGYIQLGQTTVSPVSNVQQAGARTALRNFQEDSAPTRRPDFRSDPWANRATIGGLWGGAQELPFP